MPHQRGQPHRRALLGGDADGGVHALRLRLRLGPLREDALREVEAAPERREHREHLGRGGLELAIQLLRDRVQRLGSGVTCGPPALAACERRRIYRRRCRTSIRSSKPSDAPERLSLAVSARDAHLDPLRRAARAPSRARPRPARARVPGGAALSTTKRSVICARSTSTRIGGARSIRAAQKPTSSPARSLTKNAMSASASCARSSSRASAPASERSVKSGSRWEWCALIARQSAVSWSRSRSEARRMPCAAAGAHGATTASFDQLGNLAERALLREQRLLDRRHERLDLGRASAPDRSRGCACARSIAVRIKACMSARSCCVSCDSSSAPRAHRLDEGVAGSAPPASAWWSAPSRRRRAACGSCPVRLPSRSKLPLEPIAGRVDAGRGVERHPVERLRALAAQRVLAPEDRQLGRALDAPRLRVGDDRGGGRGRARSRAARRRACCAASSTSCRAG